MNSLFFVTFLVVMPSITANPPSQNIVQLAEGSQDLSILVKALNVGGLTATLSGKGPYTVFAPTNEAFAKVPAADLQKLFKDMTALDKVLEYHVLAGHFNSHHLMSVQTPYEQYTASQDVAKGSSQALNGGSASQIVAYHCTLERDVDLILAGTFRIPTAAGAQDRGLKFGAGAYLGPNISYCISEAANTFADRYVEAQHPNQPDDDPSEKELREAYNLILTKLGRPGSGTKWAMGCIEATVDLQRVLNVTGFSPDMKWPLTGKTNGKDCKLPGRNETQFLSKDCSKYKSGRLIDPSFNQSEFDEYTSRITPQYMDYYGYDTALLYWPKRSDSEKNRHALLAANRRHSGHSSDKGGSTSSFSRRRHRRNPNLSSSSSSLSDEESNDGEGPREVVVYDWETRVKMSARGPRKVSVEEILQRWPKPRGSLKSFATLEGEKVTVSGSGSTINVNNARVLKADVQASNGVVHIIDSVLMPPLAPIHQATIVELAVANPDLSTLVTALKAADIVV